MNSFNKTWNKSYSESDLMSSYSETCSPIRSPVMIRRVMCMEEVVPSFVPIETAFYNKISSPHRRKNYEQYKARTNLHKPQVSEDIEFQIANLNLTNNQCNNSFSSFSYCSPKLNVLAIENINLNADCNSNKTDFDLNSSETQPMEVDSFKDSRNNTKVEEMDLENVENCTNPISSSENVLRLRNLRVQTPQNNEICDTKKADAKQKSFRKLLIFLIPILILGASACIFSDICELDLKEFNLENLEKDLTLVYKQDQVVRNIVNNLKNRENWRDNKKLLVFFGSSGVGKTFVTNILKANFPKKCVHEIHGRFFQSRENKVLKNFKSGQLNLVIIDDMTNNSTKNLINFINSFDSKKEILTIAVFSTVQVDDNFEKSLNFENIDKIKNELITHGINYEIIMFNHFSDDDVKFWLKNQLILHQIPSKYRQEIIESLTENYDIKLNGLKGLHSKMVLEIKNFV